MAPVKTSPPKEMLNPVTSTATPLEENGGGDTVTTATHHSKKRRKNGAKINVRPDGRR